MFGFFVAGLGVLGLVGMAMGRRRMSPMSWGLRRLDATPAQERVIREASSEIRAALSEFKKEGRKSKARLAEALGAEQFDRAKIESWIADRKLEIDQLSPRLITAVEEVHATLDGEQRQKLSGWIQRGRLHPGGRYGRHSCHH